MANIVRMGLNCVSHCGSWNGRLSTHNKAFELISTLSKLRMPDSSILPVLAYNFSLVPPHSKILVCLIFSHMHTTKNLTVSVPAHPGPQSLDRAPAHSRVRRPTIARRTAPPRVGTTPLFHAALSEPDVASVVKPSSTRENSNVKLVPHSISQLPRRKSVAHVALVHPVAIGAPIPPRALLLECARDADRCAEEMVHCILTKP